MQASKIILDAMICQTDDDCVKKGAPILSVIVRHDDGRVSDAFWQSVKKHNLRKPDETDQQVEERIRKECFAYYGMGKD